MESGRAATTTIRSSAEVITPGGPGLAGTHSWGEAIKAFDGSPTSFKHHLRQIIKLGYSTVLPGRGVGLRRISASARYPAHRLAGEYSTPHIPLTHRRTNDSPD